MDNNQLAQLLGLKLTVLCEAAVYVGENLKEAGEILLEIKKENATTEIPERMAQLGDHILTEMQLISQLLAREVAKIKEKN